MCRNTWSDPGRHTELLCIDGGFSDQAEVRIIEPFGSGGGRDLRPPAGLVRWHRSFPSYRASAMRPVENRTQVPEQTAAPALVAKSPPGGYTPLLNTSSQAYSAVLSKTLPYDPLNDFIPGRVAHQPALPTGSRQAGWRHNRQVSWLRRRRRSRGAQICLQWPGHRATHLGAVRFNFEAGIEAQADVLPRPSDSDRRRSRRHDRRANRVHVLLPSPSPYPQSTTANSSHWAWAPRGIQRCFLTCQRSRKRA